MQARQPDPQPTIRGPRETAAQAARPAGFPQGKTGSRPGKQARTDRLVREAAPAGDGIISCPGSPGHKLPKDCTPAEYDRHRLARRSQARDMIAKVVRTDRIFHRRPAVTP